MLIAPAPPAMLTAQPVALPHFAPQLPRIMTGRPFVVGPAACSALALNKMPSTFARPSTRTSRTSPARSTGT